MSAKMWDRYDEAKGYESGVRIVPNISSPCFLFQTPHPTVKTSKHSLASILHVCKYLLAGNYVLITWTFRKSS